MTDSFSNIEESFKNAFEHWEAPHSASEMNAGWNQVASHIPHGPVPHAGSAGQVAGHVASGVGKIIGFTGLGALVVASAVILYNIYVKPAGPSQGIKHDVPSLIEQPKHDSKNVAVQKDSRQNPEISGSANKGWTKPEPAKNNGMSTKPSSAPLFPSQMPENDNQSAQNNSTTSSQNLGPVKQKPANSPMQQMKLYLSDTVVCEGVPVRSGSNVSDPNLVIEWGDGNWNFFSGQNYHIYHRTGTFRAHLTIDSFRTDRIVTVLQTPKAKFLVKQSDNFYISLDNRSTNANTYTWNFGDGTPDEHSFYTNHVYTDTGRFKTRLIAINPTGCADTSYQYITIQRLTEPELTRNIITPNGDGKDDDVGVNIEGEYSLQFTIMDGTGKIVFSTTDKNIRWNGKNQFNGSDCKNGTYFYSILYSYRQNGDKKLKTGAITLKR